MSKKKGFEILKILSRRFISSIVILFLLISCIFILLRISPGDPIQKFISPELSPELAEKVRESFDLNSTIIEQYLKFLLNLIVGDFGISYNYRAPVLSVIWDYLPFTLVFASISFIIQVLFGFWFAIISLKKVRGWFDKTFSKFAIIVYSLPTYVLGILFIFIFSLQLGMFPSSDLRSYDFESLNIIEQFLDYAKHLILPLITLSLGGIVIFYKYLRDNFTSVSHKTFVLNLRASGFSEKVILYKHILPNAIRPIISVAGVELGLLFSGALITEVIFGLPGMGRLTINAIMMRDYPLIVGCSFLSGVLIIITNFVADLIKIKIDKRLIIGV